MSEHFCGSIRGSKTSMVCGRGISEVILRVSSLHAAAYFKVSTISHDPCSFWLLADTFYFIR